MQWQTWKCWGPSRKFALRHMETKETTILNNPFYVFYCRGQLKCDGTRAETRFRLSAKRTSPFKSAGGRQFSRLLAQPRCAHQR